MKAHAIVGTTTNVITAIRVTDRTVSPVAQTNEVLCKSLCFNLSMLVHAMHEHGVEPAFPEAAGLRWHRNLTAGEQENVRAALAFLRGVPAGGGRL